MFVRCPAIGHPDQTPFCACNALHARCATSKIYSKAQPSFKNAEEQARANAFDLQELFFDCQAAGKSGQCAVCADNAMARNKNRDWVSPDGIAYGLRRHKIDAAHARIPRRNIAVGRRLAKRDAQNQFPNRSAENRSGGRQRHAKTGIAS